MAIQTGSLSSVEHDWYATRSGVAANAPLNDHKRAYFIAAGISDSGPKPTSQMEKEWLQSVAGSTSLGDADLWAQVCAKYGVIRGETVNGSKYNFFTSVTGSPPISGLLSPLETYIGNMSGLMSYWPMTEKTQSGFAAAYGVSLMTGSVSLASVGQPGLIDTSYLFNGSTGALVHSVTAGLSTVQPYSVHLIFQQTAEAVNSSESLYLFQVRHLKAHIRTSSNTINVRREIGGAAVATYDLGAGDRNWHQLVAAVDPTTGGPGGLLYNYVDGSLRALTSCASPISSTYSDSIAKSGASTFAGSIQHVAIFNRVLPAAEITQLAQVARLI